MLFCLEHLFCYFHLFEMPRPRNLSTRNVTVCPALDQPAKLPIAQLPTVADVMRFFELTSFEQMKTHGHHMKGSIDNCGQYRRERCH